MSRNNISRSLSEIAEMLSDDEFRSNLQIEADANLVYKHITSLGTQSHLMTTCLINLVLVSHSLKFCTVMR